MCTVMAGLVAASTALSTMNAVQTANAQAGAANREAQIAERNEGIVRRDTAAQIRLQERDDATEMASARARLSNSGAAITSTSFTQALLQMERDQKYNREVIGYEGEKAAIGLQDEASGLRTAAGQYRRAGTYNAATSLLSGGVTAYGYQQQGLLGKRRAPARASSPTTIPGTDLPALY